MEVSETNDPKDLDVHHLTFSTLTSPRSATSTHSACTARANTSPIQKQFSCAPQPLTMSGATDAADMAGPAIL